MPNLTTTSEAYDNDTSLETLLIDFNDDSFELEKKARDRITSRLQSQDYDQLCTTIYLQIFSYKSKSQAFHRGR